MISPTIAVRRRLYDPRSGNTRRFLSTKNTATFHVSEEVRQAIAEQRPVVALESTIYTHGFPHPDNLALSSRLESLCRENGGVPATVGILDGVAIVGLNKQELERLVTSAHDDPASLLKVSRRDLAFATALTGPNGRRMNGGTTVVSVVPLPILYSKPDRKAERDDDSSAHGGYQGICDWWLGRRTQRR